MTLRAALCVWWLADRRAGGLAQADGSTKLMAKPLAKQKLAGRKAKARWGKMAAMAATGRVGEGKGRTGRKKTKKKAQRKGPKGKKARQVAKKKLAKAFKKKEAQKKRQAAERQKMLVQQPQRADDAKVGPSFGQLVVQSVSLSVGRSICPSVHPSVGWLVGVDWSVRRSADERHALTPCARAASHEIRGHIPRHSWSCLVSGSALGRPWVGLGRPGPMVLLRRSLRRFASSWLLTASPPEAGCAPLRCWHAVASGASSGGSAVVGVCCA